MVRQKSIFDFVLLVGCQGRIRTSEESAGVKTRCVQPLHHLAIYKSLGPGPHLILGFLTKARAALVNLKMSPQPLPLNEVKGQKARTLVRVSIFINGVPRRI